jgi:isoquinoline 1-oxidoreductase beta subunit
VYQCFFDEVAQAAGRDPLEFRLDMLSRSYGDVQIDRQRMSDVLKLAAKNAGWGSREVGDDRGLGLAVHFDHGAYVAYVVEVVADGSFVKVKNVFAAVDCGPVINLSGAKNVDGAAQQGNFDDYELLRIGQAPKIDVEFIQSDNSPSGLGEPPLAPAAPAVCNAIFAATGTRVNKLPFSRSGVSL